MATYDYKLRSMAVGDISEHVEVCNSYSELLQKEKCLKDKILHLNQLETLLSKWEENISSLLENADNMTVFSAFISSLVDVGLVEDFNENEERDFDASDFLSLPEAAEYSLICLNIILHKVHFLDLKSHKDIVISIVKLCATHSENFLWSNEIAVSKSKEVLEKLLFVTKCQDLKFLLCGEIEDPLCGLLKYILLSIRPSLTKETWTKNPSSRYIFKWILFNVKRPYLTDYISDILPPSLMFIDHHSVENKVLGIRCLNHIIENVPPSELKLYGRADVIYHVLYQLVYYNEPPVIDILYPCLLIFLAGQEKDPHKADKPRRWGRYDDVYNQLLWNMEQEQRIILRRSYSAHVWKYIDKLGITVARHMKRTIRVLLEYISVFDGPEEISRKNGLLALQSLIKVAWPRMEYHCEELLKGVMILIYDTETDSGTNLPEVKQEILNLSRECLLLLKQACTEKFKQLTQELIEMEEDIPAVGILRSVYNDTS